MNTAQRLYWVGMRGIAAAAGRQIKLHAPPHRPGVILDAIDWSPDDRVAMLMPRHGAWRDMTADEVAAARRVVEQIFETPQEAQPCSPH